MSAPPLPPADAPATSDASASPDAPDAVETAEIADGASAEAAAYPTPRRQLALQGGAIFLVLCIAVPAFGLGSTPWPWGGIALSIGATAFVLAVLTRQPWWWKAIHAVFFPLAWSVAHLGIDPGWFLLAAILLLLVYRGALTGQVPLFLSNRATVHALAERLPQGARVVDLGAGIGSVVFPLARLRPDLRLTGIENAPLTWFAGRLRRALSPRTRVDWRYGSLWDAALGDYDAVYAFLSPAPMPALWDKARAELPPGGLLVSNSFAVPDVAPDEEIVVADGSRQLFVYRVAPA